MTPRPPHTSVKLPSGVVILPVDMFKLLDPAAAPSKPTCGTARSPVPLEAEHAVPEGKPHALDRTPAWSVVYLDANLQPHLPYIDSGSSASLIDGAYLKKHYPNAKIQACPMRPLGGLGGMSETSSYVDMHAAFRCSSGSVTVPIRFYIITQEQAEIIIGNDVLQRFGAVLDFRQRAMWFGSKPDLRFPLGTYEVFLCVSTAPDAASKSAGRGQVDPPRD